MKRKIWTSLLTITCVISLSACGSKTETSTDVDTVVSSTEASKNVTDENTNTSENGGVLTNVLSYNGEWESIKYNIVYTYYENGELESRIYYTADGNKESEDWYDLEGNSIKSVLYDEEGNEDYRAESEYVDGNLVKYSMYNLGELTEVYEYEYDQNGGRTRTTSSNPDGDKVILGEGEWVWDDNGGTVTERSYDTNGEVSIYNEYKYDSDGNLLESNANDPDGTFWGFTEYEYDQYGNMTKSYTYDGDNTLTSQSDYEYEYDANGNVIKRTYYYNGEILEYSELSANGTVIKTMYMGDDGQLYTTYEAECDSKGNILKEYSYDLDGKVYATAQYMYE
jgi:YD repeat-containing protein